MFWYEIVQAISIRHTVTERLLKKKYPTISVKNQRILIIGQQNR